MVDEKENNNSEKTIKKCDWCDKTFKRAFGFYSHASAAHKSEMQGKYPDKYFGNRGRPRESPDGSKETQETQPIIPIPPTLFPPELLTVKRGPYKKKEKEKERITDVSSDDDIGEELSEDPLKKSYTYIPNKKSMNLTGKDLYMAELLINHGFAKDLSEVNKKSLRLAFSMLSAGGLAGNENMMGDGKNAEISVDKMMENIEKQQVRELQMEQLRNKLAGKIQGGKKMESNDLLMIMALTGGLGGNNKQENSLSQALEIVKLIQPQQQSNNLDMLKVLELMKAINPPQQQNPMQNIEFLKILMEATNKNNNNSVVDVIKTLQSSMNDKDKQSYEKELQIQRAKDEYNKQIMELKLQQVQADLNKPREETNFERLREQINVIKQLNEEIGGKGEPSTFDYIDSLGKNLSGPLTELLKARNQKSPLPQRTMRVQEEDDEDEGDELDEEEAMAHHRKRAMPVRQPPPVQKPMPVDDGVSVIPATRTEMGRKNDYVG